MPKTTRKTVKEPMVTVCIVPGYVSEYQKKLFQAFWTRLIATAQSELKAENEANGTTGSRKERNNA